MVVSFLGRRYMRDKAGPLEKWVGGFVLALAVALVVVFLLTGGLLKDFVDTHPTFARARQCFAISDKPLFAVDPKNLPQPAPPRPAPTVLATPKLTTAAVTPAEANPSQAATHQMTAPKPGIARFVDVPGDKLVTPANIERYTDNMYEKIDGKEAAFRAFHVVDLRFGQYAEPERQQTYDVYVYDMATPANAMGIYASERSDTVKTLSIGREAYSSGSSVFFWKGQYYVNVMGPPGGDQTDLSNSEQIATAISATIADDGTPFWAEGLLPARDRIAGSLAYEATSALGYKFLNRMFFAKYDSGGKQMQMFITKAIDASAATSMFAQFADSTARYDKILSRKKIDSGEVMLSESPRPGKPSRFGAAFCKGPYFGGVAHCEDRQLTELRAKEFIEKLSATDPGDPAAAIAPPTTKAEADHDHDVEESSEGGKSEN